MGCLDDFALGVLKQFFSFPLGEHPCLCNQETGSKAAKGMVQMSWCFSVAGDDTLWLEAGKPSRGEKSHQKIYSANMKICR